MMQARNEGGEDRKGDKIYPETGKLELSVCDVSSDDFKKTWLTLKELHDRELHRLQAKLTSMRKERLADGRRTGSIAKIKELTEQQKVLNDTIQSLRDQLSSKRCERCAVNETYKSTLQQECYAMQQENLKFISELTAERDKLRKENKMLSAKLKLSQQHLSLFSESDDDFIPCAQGTASVFTVKEPEEGSSVYQPMKLLKQLIGTEEIKSGGEKEKQKIPQLPLILHSPDLFDMAETSLEKLVSDTPSKPTTEASDDQKSVIFPSILIQSTHRGREFKTVSNLSEDRLGQAKKREMFRRKTSTEKTSTQMGFPGSFSSIAKEQNPEIQVVSETSEEDMPQNPTSLGSFALKKETLPSNVFPLDYTNRKRSIGIPRYNIGLSEKDGSCQIPSREQMTLRKTTKEPTGASGHSADDKPQGDNQSSILGSKIKRKSRKQSEKRK